MSEYKHIRMEKIDPYRTKVKTGVWSVVNKSSGDRIGAIRWYGPWRQYCFMPYHATVFSAGCMADIQSFINDRMAERKEGKAA